MGRRNRRKDDDEPREISLRGFRGVQHHSDGQWQVIEQLSAPKMYTCPGCNQEIKPGTANIVDRKSTRLNSSHVKRSRMPSSA